MRELQPTAPRERLLTLDVLRGCALLGVLLGNVYELYCGRRIRAATDHGRLDDAARFVVEVLVQSKAQTVLCFLSTNGVWLTEQVPPEYIAFPD